MKNIKSLLLIKILFFATIVISLASCKKFEADVAPMTPISIGQASEHYDALKENTVLQIPIKFASPCDSGIKSATYKIVNNRANELKLVFSEPMNIPFHGKTVDTMLTIPIRKGLISIVITIYDKAGKLSSKSVDITNITSSGENLKSLTNITMSTDPADNKNFFSFHETSPVFGSADAITKQKRIDFMLVNMNGAKIISPHAYGASVDYYNASKSSLAGFTNLTYLFLSSSKSYVNKVNFDAIIKESDLEKFLNDTVIALGPKGANYNIINADRRVSDTYTENDVNKGFIIGWGYHTNPLASTAIVLNESFGLVMIKAVTKKPNGHYIITFDVKASPSDQRSVFGESVIAPYTPYTL